MIRTTYQQDGPLVDQRGVYWFVDGEMQNILQGLGQSKANLENSPNILKIIWEVIDGIFGYFKSFYNSRTQVKFIIQNQNP